MIGDLFFVIKVGLYTVLMIFLMQVEVGEKTLESHSYKLITEASKTLKLNQVAHGLIQAIKEGQKMAHDSIEGWSHKNKTHKVDLNQ